MPKRSKQKKTQERTFDNPFLTEIHTALLARQKALRRQGEFLIYDATKADAEVLGASLAMSNRVACIAEFVGGGTVDLSIRSQYSGNRGKYWVRLDDLRLPSNGPLVIRTFERWCSATWEKGFWERATRNTRDVWDEIMIELVQSYDEVGKSS